MSHLKITKNKKIKIIDFFSESELIYVDSISLIFAFIHFSSMDKMSMAKLAAASVAEAEAVNAFWQDAQSSSGFTKKTSLK